MSPLVRTQISLPPDLKKKIEQLARAEGISLAEYLRRAAGSRVDRTLSSSQERARVAAAVSGISKPLSTRRRAAAWIRSIRQERIRNDERLARLERTRSLLSRRRAV